MSSRRKSRKSKPDAKVRIQVALRRIVIKRDGGCFLRNHPMAGACGGYNRDGDLILQAEHLNGRSNSISYAEPENCICLCKYHHIFFKPQKTALYWVLVRERMGLDWWLKVENWIKDKAPHRVTESEWRAMADKLEVL